MDTGLCKLSLVLSRLFNSHKCSKSEILLLGEESAKFSEFANVAGRWVTTDLRLEGSQFSAGSDHITSSCLGYAHHRSSLFPGLAEALTSLLVKLVCESDGHFARILSSQGLVQNILDPASLCDHHSLILSGMANLGSCLPRDFMLPGHVLLQLTDL